MLARGSPSTGPTGTVDGWVVPPEPPGLQLPGPLCLVAPPCRWEHVEKQDTGWVTGSSAC